MTWPNNELSTEYFEMPKRPAGSVKTVVAARRKSGGICELDEEGNIPDTHFVDGHLVVAAEKVGNIVAEATVMSMIVNPP